MRDRCRRSGKRVRYQYRVFGNKRLKVMVFFRQIEKLRIDHDLSAGGNEFDIRHRRKELRQGNAMRWLGKKCYFHYEGIPRIDFIFITFDSISSMESPVTFTCPIFLPTLGSCLP